NQEIVKLQYQKNLSTNAYFRIYGYSYYSDWLQNGPQSANANYFGPSGPDYELLTHTRGISASFADQINPQHLLQLQGSYSTASTVRDNNSSFFNGGGSVALVNANNPNAGICYDPTFMTNNPVSCNNGGTQLLAPGQPLPAIPGGATCAGGPCEYFVVENGLSATYNTVTPKFSSASITDQWKPNDKLLVNLGVRWDQFTFLGSDTTGGARTFWFNEFNTNSCINPLTGVPIDKGVITGGPFSPTTPCGSIPLAGGGFYATPNLQNVSSPAFTYNVWQPRIAATYTINPDTVVRASFGKYAEPASAAYEQYNTTQQDLPDFLGARFYQYGFTTPGHNVRPSISYNYDLSLEKHIRGTSWSYKLTPFYRKTQDQVENFFLNQQTGFISGFNAGSLTARGVELQINAGDFNRNGFAGQLAFTYTNAYVNYNTLPNGGSVVSTINQDIKNYNAYTSFCAHNPASASCAGGSVQNSTAAAPCYIPPPATGGPAIPDPTCTGAGTLANPYWNAPPQGLLDPHANYVPYDIFPAGIGASADSYNVPYVAALVLNYKHNKLAITPSFQFVAGNRYGSPESTPGVAPDTCTGTLPGGLDRGRYPFGAPGGSPFDATTCGAPLNAIPDPFTGIFDPPGSFRNPSQLLGHLQISYDISPKVTLTATFANLINHCFGGQLTPFTYNASTNICSYTTLYSAGSLVPPIGNIYNPDATGNIPSNVPQFLRFPYEPAFGPVNVDGNSTRQPFSFYLTAHIKL
ncbi:MAG: TonB-dependent receptor, partial [Candidatus Eremiobacteraeota bacterium]|nr:TonB-dependent receptor [Candidatus Eremiobacteraeota bacterium]